MTSKGPYTEAYVWIWLPGQTEPVVAGKLTAHGDRLLFNYGRSYLARDDAIAIYHPELPVDRHHLWGRQFLNPYAFDDLDGDAASLRRLAKDALT